MCGIAGILFWDGERDVDPHVLEKMRDCMVYRGPDDRGVYINGNIGLAHRRLSIIGLGTGHQPMFNSGNTLCIVFNGEIYNYLDLKHHLENKGYGFQTESDTEVIINLYAEYGRDCVSHLNGMFAFAIWDTEKKALFLARDRLGIKPLYYAITREGFAFSSEIKSIFFSGLVQPSCNNSTIYEYFMFRSVAGEQTMFQDIKSLLPGQRMYLADGHLESERYWSPADSGQARELSFEESVEELKTLLQDSVRIRMMSEVPLGTFCSGGVDSSLVTAIAARNHDRSINTFSVGFHEEKYDETDYARIVSKEYSTNHHEIKLSSDQFSDYLPELVRLNDEPMNFSNSVHIYALSKLAKQYVTVVLTGEGADELFLGYPRYQVPRIINIIQPIRGLMEAILRLGYAAVKDHRLKKLLQFTAMSHEDMILFNAAVSQHMMVDKLLDQGVPRQLDYRKHLIAESSGSNDILSRLSLQDQSTYLVSILNRQDRMSMGASVEARVPFLDYRIAEFANSVDASAKIGRFEPKKVVKKVAEEFLPREIIYRRKSGFGVPLAEWFRSSNALGGYAQRLFNDMSSSDALNKEYMLNMLAEHRSGGRDNSEMLWTAVNFLIWKEQYAV